ASVNSNSWGIQDGGAYLIDDMIYDGLVRDANIFTAGNQPLIFEFSAGNGGWGGGTPVYQSTGSPGNSKNVITTGASLNFRPSVPMVSGAAALFVQYFRNTTGADPSPAITKAALVNGAVDMPAVANPSFGSFSTAPIPNMDEGWGRLHLANVIASSAAHFYDDQTVSLLTGA